MSAWRREAIRRLPGLRQFVEECENPYSLWNELRSRFTRAYDDDDAALVRAIYEYLEWTCLQPQGATADSDLFTPAAVCFMEHIPQHPLARSDMPNWFARDEVLSSKEIFSRHIGEEAFVEMLALFPPTRR